MRFFKEFTERLDSSNLQSGKKFGASAARGLALFLLVGMAACAAVAPEGPLTKETVWAVTAGHQLIKFNGGQPGRILERKEVSGLANDESIVGIDFRVARGVLYALSSAGRLYTLDTASGALKPVGAGAVALTAGAAYGVDFNPTVDRIRVVNDAGQNLRLHPDTGAQVDFDPATPGIQADGKLAYASGDVHAGAAPRLAAAAYTYNKKDDKLTTNFAIDRAFGTLVTQGTREGVQPAVSPNTGQLFTVGSLGLGPLEDVSFDISDLDNTALAAAATSVDKRTRLYRIDLQSGQARPLGMVGDGAALRGMAIEP